MVDKMNAGDRGRALLFSLECGSVCCWLHTREDAPHRRKGHGRMIALWGRNLVGGGLEVGTLCADGWIRYFNADMRGDIRSAKQLETKGGKKMNLPVDVLAEGDGNSGQVALALRPLGSTTFLLVQVDPDGRQSAVVGLSGEPTALRWSTNRNMLAIGFADGRIELRRHHNLFDVVTPVPPPLPGRVDDIVWAPGEAYLAYTGEAAGTTYVWSPHSGALDSQIPSGGLGLGTTEVGGVLAIKKETGLITLWRRDQAGWSERRTVQDRGGSPPTPRVHGLDANRLASYSRTDAVLRLRKTEAA